ncbi:MAG: tetratricopeptide repeat protein, partial [Polyangiaceae bacterium]
SHFSQGVAEFEKGDFEAACALFRRADSEHHAPVIVYNIARSEERLDHPQAAIDSYDAYLREAGESGEFASAAALAMAQIRARSPRLKIETTPPGARVFVDSVEASEKSPTSVLVTVGHHRVSAEGDGWRGASEIDATDPSQGLTVTLARPATAAESLPLVHPQSENGKPADVPTHLAPSSESVPIPEPRGLVFGLSFDIVGYYLGPARGRPDHTEGVAPALMGDIGYALTPRAEIMLRVLGGIGSEGTPVTLVEGIGPAFSLRVLPPLWIGAACLGGRIESSNTPSDGVMRYYETGWVFAPQVEVSFALLKTSYGQWMLNASPGYYFASPADNGAFFVPVGFGLRTF